MRILRGSLLPDAHEALTQTIFGLCVPAHEDSGDAPSRDAVSTKFRFTVSTKFRFTVSANFSLHVINIFHKL